MQNPAVAAIPVIDGYEILSLLGRGGMGRVYKARSLRLDRLVAIKMLLDSGDDLLLSRFRTESQAVARMQHPNIAQIFETGEQSSQPFLVLEYVDGGSLAQKIAGKPQVPDEAARIVELLARAIQHSHEHQVLHRDLKPGNVLMTADGSPKITDFGLAKRLRDDSRLTRTGEILGTPAYMAPEQASGVVANLGPAVDVYALGAILYEMLTGRPPFQGPDSMQTLMMVLTMDPVAPRRLLPKVPGDLETICLKCLEKTPRRRYPDAAALADDVRRYLEGRPIVARPAGPLERAVKWSRRRPAAALLIAVSFAAVLALVFGFLQIQAANQRLRESIAETKKSLTLARAAIDRTLVRLSDQLAPVPQSEAIRRESLEDARRLYEELTSIRPGDQDGVSDQAEALGKLGGIYSELGRLDDAEKAYRKSLDFYADLLRQDPSLVDQRRNLAGLLLNLANLERRRGEVEAATNLCRRALDEIGPLLKDDEPQTLQNAGAIHNTLALLLRAQGSMPDSEQQHRLALDYRERWLKREPKNMEAKIAVAVSLSNLATLALVSRPAEAASLLLQAEKLVADSPSPQHRLYLGQFQANRAIAGELLTQDAEAEAAHAEALATLTALVRDYPSPPEYRFLLAKEHLNLARYYAPKGKCVEAQRQLQAAGPLFERLMKEFPDQPAYRIQHELYRKIDEMVAEDIAAAKKK